jgi:hypothetical protein
MLKDFLKEVQAVSEFEAEIFGGQLIVKGRILSPAEIEKASLANSLLLQGLSSTGEISQFQKMSEQLQDDPDEETLQQAYSMLSKIRPEQMQKIAESQDQLIAQCVTQAKKSEEAQWERIQIVLTQQEQNAERNMLWIGMLSKPDRSVILDHALKGQGVAVKRLSMFR